MIKLLSVFLLVINISVFSLEYKSSPEDLVKALLLEKKYSIEQIHKDTGISIDKIKEIQTNLEKEDLSLEDKHLAALALLGKNNEFSRAIAKEIISEIENNAKKNIKLLADVYDTLGCTYFFEKQIMDALTYFELSLKYNANNFHVLKSSGKIYEHLGRFNDALLSYKKALKLDPSHEKVQFYLKDLEEYLKANPDAEDVSESLKKKDLVENNE